MHVKVCCSVCRHTTASSESLRIANNTMNRARICGACLVQVMTDSSRPSRKLCISSPRRQLQILLHLCFILEARSVCSQPCFPYYSPGLPLELVVGGIWQREQKRDMYPCCLCPSFALEWVPPLLTTVFIIKGFQQCFWSVSWCCKQILSWPALLTAAQQLASPVIFISRKIDCLNETARLN